MGWLKRNAFFVATLFFVVLTLLTAGSNFSVIALTFGIVFAVAMAVDE